MDKEIEIDFVHICENVIVAKNGNLSVINIFKEIITDKLPFIFAQMFVVISVKGDEGEYPVNIKIEKKDKTEMVIDFKPIPQMKIPSGTMATGRFFARFSPMMFKSFGFYNIGISVGKKHKKIDFEVKKVKTIVE